MFCHQSRRKRDLGGGVGDSTWLSSFILITMRWKHQLKIFKTTEHRNKFFVALRVSLLVIAFFIFFYQVLQALRRLKGTSKNKEKMTTENKQLFDQLTEDAMRLLENGDYS